MRQREDHMKVADSEQLIGASGEPFIAGVGLAFWTMPVPAGEEGDGAMAASGALIEMTAERCSAAALDGPQYLELLPAQMRPVSFDEALARATDNVGHLQGGPFHLLFFSRERLVS